MKRKNDWLELDKSYINILHVLVFFYCEISGQEFWQLFSMKRNPELEQCLLDFVQKFSRKQKLKKKKKFVCLAW